MSSPPEKQDPALLAKTLASNVQLYQSDDLPYGGTYEGVEGFLAWGKTMGSLFSKVDVKPSNVLENGEDVIVISTLHLTVRKTGRELANPFLQHVKVDREAGKIVEMRPFYWNVKGLNDALNEA